MEDPFASVIGHYESIDEGRRITEGFGRLELLRTQEVLRRHLPPPGGHILDVGGAKGVHAAWLADDGYDVHVIDPVASHVEAVRDLPARRPSTSPRSYRPGSASLSDGPLPSRQPARPSGINRRCDTGRVTHRAE
jgi:2-polyprenyl-3-methyl-5-hydroxy-6-metoxy-1,4-benzoquinol methylase